MNGGNVGRVLVVCDEQARGVELGAALAGEMLAIEVVTEVAAACQRLRQGSFGAVVADLVSPNFSCVAVLRCAAVAQPPARVICVFREPGSSRTTSTLIREAAFACLERDAGIDGVREKVRAALNAQLATLGMYENEGAVGSRVAPNATPGESGGGTSWR